MLPDGAASSQLWSRDVIANPSPRGQGLSLYNLKALGSKWELCGKANPQRGG